MWTMRLGDTNDLLEDIVQALEDPLATDWITAGAAALTLIVAVVALGYAIRQVGEAKKAREQTRELETARSQPYVVAYMEPSAVNNLAIDFVIKNYGQTAAMEVKFSVDPTMTTSNGDEVRVPAVIPLLAPGQEWRVSWDVTAARLRSGKPDVHKGRVRFKGLEDKAFSSEVVLDWSIYKSRRWFDSYGVHAGAQALREIRSLMAKWTESPSGPLSVIVRDGDAMDAGSGPKSSESDGIEPQQVEYLADMLEHGYAEVESTARTEAPPTTGDQR
ncbi:hypothetical protein GCM10010460_19100 [Microbacterium terrae]|uniref:Uncharacterized protein n=2 Tax=Microbacterium terrae TaxID=69369 RepID=A0A0M2HGG8_9MICO|nr:hypothetical protein RS81_00091 [Microbacterium terrae]GLJ97552.1 hypothetical protein GCM10017594_07490 [Microbacterium terrae]